MKSADLFKTAGKLRALNKVKIGIFKGQKSENLTSNMHIFSSRQFTYLDKSTFAGRFINTHTHHTHTHTHTHIYIYID